MSMYLVQCRKLTGTLVGYLAHGKVVQHRRNATPYDSPSSAERAAKARPVPDYYYTVVPERRKKK